MRKFIGTLLLGTLMGGQVLGCTLGDEGPDDTPLPEPEPTGEREPWGAPVSGGTLLVTRDGAFAVAADPDRDRVVTVDLATHEVVADLALQALDEPGRVVEDGSGRIHIALRRAGAIVTLAGPKGPVLLRRDVCAEPRGLAWQASGNQIHVACAGGELVTLLAGGGAATRTVRLDRDLRDVVVVGDKLMVTRFKTAEVLTIDAVGGVIARELPPSVQRSAFSPDTGEITQVSARPAVAWRAAALPDGSGIVVAHQRARLAPLSTSPGGYGGDMCGTPIEPTVTAFGPGRTPVAGRTLLFSALPVDLAVSPNGQSLAFAMAGDRSVRVVRASMLAGGDTDPCNLPPEDELTASEGRGIPTSVAFTPDGNLIVFYADELIISQYALPFSGDSWSVLLPGEYGYDPGREVFHQLTGAGIACASCHPEGREDGLVWEFKDLGLRRTQQVGGNILARAPYHWDGDMTDLGRLMTEVFVGRMGGQPLQTWQVTALGKWLDRLPSPAPATGADPLAVARGRSLFNSIEVGCATCHAGPIFTNNQRFDVGTGGPFKVPSLVGVGARAPFLHDGCATTLRDRFTCGGDRHGGTSNLSNGDLDDLLAFLESI